MEQSSDGVDFTVSGNHLDVHSVHKRQSEAVEWYRKSAEQNDADGQNNLGFMYANGFGVEEV